MSSTKHPTRNFDKARREAGFRVTVRSGATRHDVEIETSRPRISTVFRRVGTGRDTLWIGELGSLPTRDMAGLILRLNSPHFSM